MPGKRLYKGLDGKFYLGEEVSQFAGYQRQWVRNGRLSNKGCWNGVPVYQTTERISQFELRQPAGPYDTWVRRAPGRPGHYLPGQREYLALDANGQPIRHAFNYMGTDGKPRSAWTPVIDRKVLYLDAGNKLYTQGANGERQEYGAFEAVGPASFRERGLTQQGNFEHRWGRVTTRGRDGRPQTLTFSPAGELYQGKNPTRSEPVLIVRLPANTPRSADEESSGAAAPAPAGAEAAQPRSLEDKYRLRGRNLYADVDDRGDLRDPISYPEGSSTKRYTSSHARNFQALIAKYNVETGDIPKFWELYVSNLPNVSGDRRMPDEGDPAGGQALYNDKKFRGWAKGQIYERLDAALQDKIRN